jgi:hypothetical protein
MRDLGPSRWGRALFEQDTHEQMHLTALTGLPTLHMGWLPDLLLRERIEDTTPESFARFNVRWVVAVGESPSLGKPESEVVIGDFHIREVGEWDGKFARIEQGTGEVVVHRLDDRAVEIEVTGTTEPVLVALGMGYYPRWRARHASGVAEPVYAFPATPTSELHVVSAWVAPGRTTFTVDGPLPSDGSGRLLALAALLLVLAGGIAWSRPHWRVRVLRRVAELRRRARGAGAIAVRVAVPAIVVLLIVRGAIETVAPMKALHVGSGIRSTATVEARFLGGNWTECEYARVRGEYDCDGLVIVRDGTVNLVNDAPPSWPLITPAVIASAYAPSVEVRITRTVPVSGRYWAAASHDATLEIEGHGSHELSTAKRELDLVGDRRVTITAELPYPAPLQVTLVAERTIEPKRPFLAPPPNTAPPQVRAIH